MTVNPDDAFTWAHGTTDGQDAIAERIKAKLVVRGLKFGENAELDKVWGQAIAMMVSWKAMNVLLRHDEVTELDRQRLDRVNNRVMAKLVVAGLWTSPWVEVAQDEFPDIHFDQAEVDEFIAEMPGEVERHNRIEHISLPQPADMIAFLQDHGYDVQPADEELIMSLVMQSLASQFMAAIVSVDDDASRPDLGEIFSQIFDRASQPLNGAWIAFVEHFYRKGSDDEQ
jgi:hypothetical protein